MANLSRREIVATTLVFVLVASAPFLGSRLVIYNLTIAAIFSCVVVGLNILIGLAGQASFAQTTFTAIGGYGSAILTVNYGLNPWLAMLLAAVLALSCSVLIGAPLLRLRGHYFAMATFALALGTNSFVGAAGWLTNGTIGIAGIPPLAIANRDLDTPLEIYILAWLFCAFCLAIAAKLTNSHIGRAWRALATGPDVASALAINVARYKLLAFSIAAVLASIAGSIYVEFTSFVGPDLYDINAMIAFFLMLFVGGRGSFIGPVIGSLFFVFIPQLISAAGSYQNLIFFVLLLLLLLVRPDGVMGKSGGGIPLAGPLRRYFRDRILGVRS